MNPIAVHGARILILDDQETNLNLLDKILLNAHYPHIHRTSSPDKVIDLYRSDHCDLIILDMDFLGSSGFELLKTLGGTEVAESFCAIVISSNADWKLRALQAGAKDFISKPFDTDLLLARIHNILEAHILYRALESSVAELKQQFEERTAELQENEARFRAFTDLALDWYWEQDMKGNFTKVSGPVPEILGIEVDSTTESTNTILGTGWNPLEQSVLRAKIALREPFLDFEFSRHAPDGSQQTFLVSGQPMFDRTCNFLGYRGVGVEISAAKNH